MSETVAAILTKFIDLALLPMNKRQVWKTKAHIANDLMRQGSQQIVTKRGTLTFSALRGAGAASAVATFETDEPETRDWIDELVKPGETLWDIGASIGLYSMYAALDSSVKVIAFEPSALNFSLLSEHVALNDMGGRLTPLCMALAGETKLDVLHMSRYDTGTAGNALGRAETQCMTFTPVNSQGISAFTGDDFCEVFHVTPPNHIKMDVDGIEGEILKGLKRTLSQVSSVLIEVQGRNVREGLAQIEESFSAAGFEERVAVRDRGSRRNRLYINKRVYS
jgi:FkbM family methyltransferase